MTNTNTQNKIVDTKKMSTTETIKNSLSLAGADNGIRDLIVDWLIARQLKTDKARVTYLNSLRVFLRFIDPKTVADFANLTSESLLAFSRKLDTAVYYRDKNDTVGRNYSVSSKQVYFTIAKTFCQFLVAKGILNRDITIGIRNFKRENDEHTKDALETGEVKSLIENARDKVDGAKTVAKSATAKRNLAIVSLMATTGVRACEVCRANFEDIRREHGKFYLYVQGKGYTTKNKPVEIAPGVMNQINDYLLTRKNIKGSEPLFKSQKVTKKIFMHSVDAKDAYRLSPESLSRLLKKELKAVGIDSERKTGHSLRHFCADSMIDNGVDIRSVQKVLRHKSVTTTEIYLSDRERYSLSAETLVAASIGFTTTGYKSTRNRRGVNKYYCW